MGDEKPGGGTKTEPKPPDIPPWLPLPKDFRDFLTCKISSITLDGKEHTTGAGNATTSVAADATQKGHFTITIKDLKSAFPIDIDLPDTLKLDCSIENGKLHIRLKDVKLPKKVKEGIKGFQHEFNKFLKDSGKKVADPETKDGKLVLSKVVATAMLELPRWEKVGAVALMVLVTTGGIAAKDAGDTTTRGSGPATAPVSPVADEPPKLALGDFCEHHDEPPAEPDHSVIEFQGVVEGVPRGDRLLAKFDGGPNGGPASEVGTADAKDGFVDIVVDVTGRGPGAYTGFSLSDQATGATLAKPVALSTFEIVGENSKCMGREELVRKVENSSSSKGTPSATTESTDAPPWSLAVAGGLDVMIGGALLLDRWRRRRELGPDFDDGDDDEFEDDATGRGRDRLPPLVGDGEPPGEQPPPTEPEPTEPEPPEPEPPESVLDDIDTSKASPLDKQGPGEPPPPEPPTQPESPTQPPESVIDDLSITQTGEQLPSLVGKQVPPMGGSELDVGGMDTIDPPPGVDDVPKPDSVIDDLDRTPHHPDEIA